MTVKSTGIRFTRKLLPSGLTIRAVDLGTRKFVTINIDESAGISVYRETLDEVLLALADARVALDHPDVDI